MSKKDIEKFLPKEKEKEIAVNFYQEESLAKRLKKKLKEKGISIKDFYNAAANSYLSEE
ncbi:MAG: hypothetical protein ACHQUC_01410 [Chlamydiales bacterium]